MMLFMTFMEMFRNGFTMIIIQPFQMKHPIPSLSVVLMGITRGGNYESSPNQLKSSYRSPTLTNTRNEFIGFRVVRSIIEGE